MFETATAITASDMGPQLNPALPVLHIPDILTPGSAQRLYKALKDETPWRLTVNKGNEIFDVPNVSPEKRQIIAIDAWERARTQFQYVYDNHRLSHDGEPYADPGHYFAKLVAFLNAPHFLAAMRAITGIEEIGRTVGQATLYRPGDFLTQHEDLHGNRNRLAAYVFNMTPAWRPDWGGLLLFYNERGHIEEGFVPAFNALNIFRVPAPHSVSQVAPFGGMRYSVTGWFHESN
jgi:SM-20-related protein